MRGHPWPRTLRAVRCANVQKRQSCRFCQTPSRVGSSNILGHQKIKGNTYRASITFYFFGAPGEIRTPDHLVRSQVLYPTELRAHISDILGNVLKQLYPLNSIIF